MKIVVVSYLVKLFCVMKDCVVMKHCFNRWRDMMSILIVSRKISLLKIVG